MWELVKIVTYENVDSKKGHLVAPLLKPLSCKGYLSTTNRPQPHVLVIDGTYSRLADVPIAGNQVSYKGYLEPCGVIRVGVCPVQGGGKRDREERDSRRADVSGVLYGDVLSTSGEWNQDTPTAYCPNEPPHLSCQVSQSVASGRTRVARTLTSRGKRYIRNGCFLLESAYGVKGLGFYTLTCPYSLPEEITKFNESFAGIVKRFLEEVRRCYLRKGLKFAQVGVYEIQEKRFAATGVPVLHYHFVSPCYESRGRFVLTSGEIRAIYARIIENFTGIKPPHKPRVGTEVVRQSSAKYLSKYCSKGISVGTPEILARHGVRLSSWYSISRDLRVLVIQTTRPLSRSTANAIFGDCKRQVQAGCQSHIYPIEIEVCGEEKVKRLVGFMVYPEPAFVDACRKSLQLEIYKWKRTIM
jgi:hypothetical protein